jgi:uncharacterized protein (UPF0333 family)
MGIRTRIPICPTCNTEIKEVTRMYGQKSYICKPCNSWGAWSSRKTIRNPGKPKAKMANPNPAYRGDE